MVISPTVMGEIKLAVVYLGWSSSDTANLKVCPGHFVSHFDGLSQGFHRAAKNTVFLS